MNLSTCLKVTFTIGLFAIQMAMPVHAEPPTVTISLKSIDEILDDADFVAEAAGHEGLKDFVETNIDGMTGGMGLAGLDRERPLGLYWRFVEGDPNLNSMATLVAFLPIVDSDKFEKLVRKFFPDLKSEEGKWSTNLHGLPVFATFANDYCFIGFSQKELADLADPEKIVNEDYDIAIEINLASIPQEIKQTYLGMMTESAQNGFDDQPEPLTEGAAAARKLAFGWMLAAATAVVQDGDSFTLGLDVDSETRMVSFDLGLSGKPNTRLGDDLALYGKTKPVFAAVGSGDAPFQLVMSLPTSGLGDKTDELVDALRKSSIAEIEKDPTFKNDADRKSAKDFAIRLFDIAEATIKSGSLHSVAVMERGDDDTVRVVAGTKLAKGDDASQLLDDVIKQAKESPDLDRIKPDVAKHAGARIHAISPDLTDKQIAQFGKDPCHLAIRADSLWFSLGNGNLEALKKALDLSAKTTSQSDAPFSLHLKPAALVKLIQMDDSELLQHAEGLVGEPGDVLNVELTPQETTGIKLHIEFGIDLFSLGVLQISPVAE